MKHLKWTTISETLLLYKFIFTIMTLLLLLLMVLSGLCAAYANDSQQEVNQSQFKETNDFGITITTNSVPFAVEYVIEDNGSGILSSCSDLSRSTAKTEPFSDTNISNRYIIPAYGGYALVNNGYLYYCVYNEFGCYVSGSIKCPSIANPKFYVNDVEVKTSDMQEFDIGTSYAITVEDGSAPEPEMTISAITLENDEDFPNGIVANYIIENDFASTLTNLKGTEFRGAPFSSLIREFKDTNVNECKIIPSFTSSTGFYLNPANTDQLIYSLTQDDSGLSVTAILDEDYAFDFPYDHVEWRCSTDGGINWSNIDGIGPDEAIQFESGKDYLFGLIVVENPAPDIIISAKCENGYFDVEYENYFWEGTNNLTATKTDEFVDSNINNSIIAPVLNNIQDSNFYTFSADIGVECLLYTLRDTAKNSVSGCLCSNPDYGEGIPVWYVNGEPVDGEEVAFESDDDIVEYNFELRYEESPGPEPDPDLEWHDVSVSVDRDPGTRPEGFDGWNVETYFAGIYMPFYSQHYSMPFIYYPELIPDYALIGVDDQYRLHVRYADPVLPFLNWDIYLDACEKPGYEQYAWYVDPAWGFKSIGLDDNADCGEKGSLMLGIGKLYGFTPDMPVHFTAEYIGKVDVSATGGVGHAGLEMDYFINNHDVPEATAVQETWNTYVWEGTVVGVDTNGVLEFVSTDDYNNYFECGHLKAISQDGYVFKSWTIDGVEYPVGQEAKIMTVQYKQAPISVVANYQPVYAPVPDPGQGGGQEIGGGAQTGDAAGMVFVIATLIAVAGACGTFRARKQIIK